MVTYLYGSDRYRIQEYLREHAAGAMVGEEALKTQGLFGPSRVVLYEPSKDVKIPEDMEVFVVSEKKIKKGLEFKPLKGNEIKDWVQQELGKQDFTIAPDALALLAGMYRDTWYMKLELDKLCNYANEKKKIEKSDFDAVSSVKIEENIFKLTDAIANKQKGEAVLLLERQLAQGADPYYLFSMVVYQFRNMIAPKRSGVHPFAAQKAQSAASRFEPTKLKTLYQSLHRLELDAKQGKRDIIDGLYQFVFNV